uniref:SH2 domain-containing protein n=1 Tax=Anisakis simplex TaxID=6269 RepID=A0A0M3J7S4_ANISI
LCPRGGWGEEEGNGDLPDHQKKELDSGSIITSLQISSKEAGGMGRSLNDEPYYHGFMSAEECEPLLKNSGDFLVRKVQVDGEAEYAITVRVDASVVMSFLIKRSKSVRLYYRFADHHR